MISPPAFARRAPRTPPARLRTWRDSGALPPLLAGALGGLLATYVTFVPCFLWVLAGAPFVERLRRIGWLTAALAGVTAAVVGVIANLALWFGLHTLFATVTAAALGPVALPLPDWTSFDWRAGLIAVFAGITLLRLHWNLFAVLGLAALAGASLF